MKGCFMSPTIIFCSGCESVCSKPVMIIENDLQFQTGSFHESYEKALIKEPYCDDECAQEAYSEYYSKYWR